MDFDELWSGSAWPKEESDWILIISLALRILLLLLDHPGLCAIRI